MALNTFLIALDGAIRGFVSGFAENFTTISKIIHSQLGETQHQHQKKPAKPQQQQPKTELALRRADRRRAASESEGGPVPVETSEPEETETEWMVLKKLLLTNIFICLACVISVTHIVMPLGERVFGSGAWKVSEFYLTAIIGFFWLVPNFLIMKIYNAYWISEYAFLAYRRRKGRPAEVKVTFLVSDTVFTIVMELLLIIEVFGLGQLVSFQVWGYNVVDVVLTSITYALYAFEYKWIFMGIGCKERLEIIDKNIFYYLGFGFPMALIVLFSPDFWIRFVLFSILFPCLMLVAMEATEPHSRSGSSTTFIFFLPARATRYIFQFMARLFITIKYLSAFSRLQLAAIFIVLAALSVLSYLYAVPVLYALLGILGRVTQSMLGRLSEQMTEWLSKSSESSAS